MKAMLLALAVAAMLVGGCVGQSASNPPPSGNSVDISNYAFSPASLSVSAGTTVTWTNTVSTPHTVTGDTGAFDSGQLANGGTFTHTFSTAGTYPYHCANHPSMKATITVT